MFQKKITEWACLVFSLSFFILVACENPVDEKIGIPPELTSPSRVGARCNDTNNGFLVSWDPVEGADYYQVYRQVGWGEMELIAARCYNTYYIDYYQTYKRVRYYIVACTEDTSSEPSEPTPYISMYVLNVTASRFEFDDRIEVTWDAHASAAAYLVYRGRNQSDPEPVVFEGITGTFFSDLHTESDPASVQHDKPYYYLVTFVDEDNLERGLNGSPALGVFGANVDFYEPNDDYTLLADEEHTTRFTPSQPPLIFSFGDEDGGVDADVDWCLYYGPPVNFVVKVQLPEDTPFTAGQLRCRFYFPEGELESPEQPIYTRGINLFSFDSFGEVTGNEPVRVYFKLYPVVPAARDIAGAYFVEITDEL